MRAWFSASRIAASKSLFMAEGVGFEPTETCASHAFQACRFGRSRTPPWVTWEGYLSKEGKPKFCRFQPSVKTLNFIRVSCLCRSRKICILQSNYSSVSRTKFLKKINLLVPVLCIAWEYERFYKFETKKCWSKFDYHNSKRNHPQNLALQKKIAKPFCFNWRDFRLCYLVRTERSNKNSQQKRICVEGYFSCARRQAF